MFCNSSSICYRTKFIHVFTTNDSRADGPASHLQHTFYFNLLKASHQHVSVSCQKNRTSLLGLTPATFILQL